MLPTRQFNQSLNEFTPQVSIRWEPASDNTLYFNYSEGFKSGGYVGRYIVPTSSPSEFAPEYVDNYELGYKYRNLENAWSIDLAVFHSDYEDIQVLVFQGIVPLTENAARASITGAEAEGRVKVTERLQLVSSVGYIDAEYRDVGTAAQIDIGDDFVNTPQWSMSVNLAFDKQIGGKRGMFANLGYSWRSEVANDAPNTTRLVQGAMSLVDAQLGLTLDEERYAISLYGKNITDEEYLVSGAADLPSFGLVEANVARGRELGIAFSISL